MGSFNYEQGRTANGYSERPVLNGHNRSDRVAEFAKNDLERHRQMLMPANHLLQRIPSGILKKLGPYTRKVVFSGGEFISRPDEDIEWIYFPESTAISELHILEDGRTIEVSLTGREGAVGLYALNWPGSSANWMQVSTPGTAIKIKRDALRRETAGLDWVTRVFNESMHAYYAQISQKVACNAHHSVEQRFATWLLMLNDRCATDRLKLTQEHIARVLGVYRPSVTCIAQSMRDRGIIDYRRSSISIRDRDVLKEVGCGCYSEILPTAGAELVEARFDQRIL
jgi:CRP-like cAMP-binding protein